VHFWKHANKLDQLVISSATSHSASAHHTFYPQLWSYGLSKVWFLFAGQRVVLSRVGRKPGYPILSLTAHVHESQLDIFLNNDDLLLCSSAECWIGNEGSDTAAGIFFLWLACQRISNASKLSAADS
jgi:hypothetical protein